MKHGDVDELVLYVECALVEAAASCELSQEDAERIALRELRRACREGSIGLTHDLARRVLTVSLRRSGHAAMSGEHPAVRISSRPPERESWWRSLYPRKAK